MARSQQAPYLRERKRKGCAPVYEIVWHIAGKRHARTTGSTDRDVAEERLQHFIKNEWLNPTDRDLPPSRRKIATVLDSYWKEHGKDVSDPARIGYCIDALKGWWGTRTVDDVSTRACKAYAKARGVGAGTVRRELGCLEAAINHDYNERRLARKVPVWKPKPPPAKERWLTRPEAASLLRPGHQRMNLMIHPIPNPIAIPGSSQLH